MILFGLLLVAETMVKKYGLVPPHELTNVSECGEWSLRGAAIAMKPHIRLVSPARDEIGGICGRIPTSFVDWLFEMDVSVTGQENGGWGLRILFSKEVCPDDSFSGVGIFLNTTVVDTDQLSRVHFVRDGNVGSAVKSISLRNMDKIVQIKMRRMKNTLQIVYPDLSSTEVNVAGLSEFGYFSVRAETSEAGDAFDIHAIRVIPLSEAKDMNFADISKKNRKILEDFSAKRKQAKGERRKRMKIVNSVLEKANSSSFALYDEDNDMRDAIRIISEAYERGRSGITVDALMKFIDQFVQVSSRTALTRVRTAFEDFSDLRMNMLGVQSNLQREMLDLRSAMRETMYKLGNETIQKAKRVTLGTGGSGVNMKIQDPRNTPTSPLLIIMLLEITVTIGFFLYKHRKTSGFKKYD